MRALVVSVVAVIACSSNTMPRPLNSDGAVDAVPPMMHPDAPPGANPNTITGAVGGRTFTSAVTVMRSGKPDDPSNTLVYVLDEAITCAEVSSPGWDTRISDGTQVLEIKMLGKSAASYAVPTKAEISYTLSSQTSTPPEQSATGGSASLDVAVTGTSGAQGSFDITFAHGHLSGTFDAPFCADGVEP
jgi:hypothetical protein